ncbi:MAG: glucose-1-phosphate thymidylyltransferase RfbA [Oscillospiraceae bacterium]
MKGIILAGGKGTRLIPITKTIPKPLLPVYDKPLIYYPLSLLIQAGIKDVLIIVPPNIKTPFEELFGDGSQIGINISYKEQPVQRGIADAFIVGEEFIGDDNVCLMLSDNIFMGPNMDNALKIGAKTTDGATIFGYYVDDPSPFGVVEFDEDGKAISLEEKPKIPKSNYIVPGMYFYDNSVIEVAKTITPSPRGELEITTVNEYYLKNNKLNVITLDKDTMWFDAGTPDNLLKAANCVAIQEKLHSAMIGNVEEEAYKAGYIDKNQLLKLANDLCRTDYGQYLKTVAENS